ncbi:MAG: UvrD-helicase domain-containing protein, partial [Clostridiales bacterium]|nr:UvrD-helicase domain-containing protein [Clostridiales bacterium]
PFTPNQLRAITESGNMIVSAGAGSGKTTVMIARIINKLIHGARLDEMLIVTFTRASAADMRVKLAEKLVKLKLSDDAPKSVREAAADAIDAMSVANIGTLHSYCQKLIKTYFYAAQIDPSAIVCEESEATAIKRAAVASAVASAWADGDAYFADMYDALRGRRGDDGVVNAVSDILDFALSVPDPEAYLTDVKDDETRFSELDGILAEKRCDLIARAVALKAELTAAGMDKHARVTEEFADYIDGKIDDITSTSFRAQGDMCDELNERFKSLKAECKELRALCTEADKAKTLNSAPYVRALCNVALDALERYGKKKEQIGKTDYSDLEHGAYKVLENAECMREISDGIKYVFIDEFQDVNPLQARIAQKFKDCGAEMFVVGDVKQSIYGFRRCSPRHFQAAVTARGYTHVALADNFRSAQAVIDFVNRVFDKTMTDGFGGADYADPASGQRLVYGNKSIVGGCAGLTLIDKNVDRDDAAPPSNVDSNDVYSVVKGVSAGSKTDAEAKFIADSVTEWIKSGENSLSSVAVLMRSFNAEFCSALASEFDVRGIRYTFGRKSKAKDFTEVTELTDIARFVDNRYDDVALFTAMRSPMGGFSDEQIAEIAAVGEAELKRIAVRKAGERQTFAFWQKVDAYSGELLDKIEEFMRLRAQFVDYSKRNRDSAEVLGYITSSIDYFDRVYETGGNAAAVEAIIDCAAERHCGLHEFLSYYDGTDFELSIGACADAVNITTVHASKGLEYDYVILADVARKFNERDNSARIMTCEEGIAVKIPNAETRTLNKSAPWIIQNILAPQQTKAEELRLLYVALTRAKRKLTVCGKTDGKSRTEIEPCEAKRMLDFMSHIPAVAPPPLLPISDGVEPEPLAPVAEITDEIKRRIARSCAYAQCDLPIKTCVTAIAAHSEASENEEDYLSAAPILTSDDRAPIGDRKTDDDGTNARLRGTAYHRAMELIDFADPRLENVKERCENFDLIDGDEILRAASAMRELTRGAAFVAKERYFICDVSASEAFVESDSDESVLVQGVIDLLIAYPDGTAVIVDYKTGDPKRLVNDGYRTQLRLYSAAVERTAPLRVTRKCLYSFVSGELIDL